MVVSATSWILLCLYLCTAAVPLWFEQPSTLAHKGRNMVRGIEAGLPKVPRVAKLFQLSRHDVRGIFESDAEEVWVEIPTPWGSTDMIRLERTYTMHPSLHAQYPNVRSYNVVDSSMHDLRGTVSFSHGVFSASISSPRFAAYGGRFYVESIDPIAESDLTDKDKHDLYWSFWRTHYSREEDDPFVCHHDSHAGVHVDLAGRDMERQAPVYPFDSSGEPRRLMRLALACTYEYYAYFNSDTTAVLAEYDKLIARVNEVYIAELNIEFELIADITLLIETNENDGYSSNNTAARIDEAQQKIPATIPCAANDNHCFELGHVVHAGPGGGLAAKSGICNNAQYCRATTGLRDPVGDPFYVDYYAHELGHQLGMDHTFDADDFGTPCGDGARVPTAAYEPGSGSTIMAYAGLCGESGADQDIQMYTDPYFHFYSLQQGLTLVKDPACNWYADNAPATTPTSNNIPVISWISTTDITVPANTPFRLAVSAYDPDGDDVTITVEQADLGDGTNIGLQTASGVMWRSYSPSQQQYRDFPVLPEAPRNGETLSTISRELSFVVTARDGKGGFTMLDPISVHVNDSITPLRVTTASLPANGDVEVQWTVGGTGALSAFVAIDMRDFDGTTFSLISSTPNDGSETVTLPRQFSGPFVGLRVSALSNIFFHETFAVVDGFQPESDQSVEADREIIWDETAIQMPIDIVLEFNTLVAFKVTSGIHGVEATDEKFRRPLLKNETGYIKPADPVPRGYQILRRFDKPGRYYVRDPIAQDAVYGSILVEEQPLQCQLDPTGLFDCPASTPKPFWLNLL